jgi:hypothetical protein
VFKFETITGDSETHAGLDTREGKLLRLKLQFKDDPVVDLKRADNSVIATLRRGYSYNEVKVDTFLRFTRMINISNAGIGVSE